NRGAAAKATVVVDHAESAHQPDLRIGYLPPGRLTGELPDRLHHAEEAARGPGLPGGKLAAARVEREVAVPGEAVLAHERRPFALAAEAEVLELHQRDERVVVVDLHEMDFVRRAPRLGV